MNKQDAVSSHSEFNKPPDQRDWWLTTIEHRRLQRLIYEAIDILGPIKNGDETLADWDQLRDWLKAARQAVR